MSADSPKCENSESFLSAKNNLPSLVAFFISVMVIGIALTTIIAPSFWLKEIQTVNQSSIISIKMFSSVTSQLPIENRVALCIAGNARTFYLPPVHENIIDNIVTPLREQYPTDVFALIKISDDPRPGQSTAPTKDNETLQAISLLSPTMVLLLNSSHDYKNERILTNEREIYPPTECGESNDTAMAPFTLHRSAQCLSAIEDYEQSKGMKYRWIYRVRPDVALLDKILTPDEIEIGNVYVNEAPVHPTQKFTEWWHEKHDAHLHIPSLGDHFLAAGRVDAGVALRAVEAVNSCELFEVRGSRNSESILWFWLLSHGLRISGRLWSWSVVRSGLGPDCERVRKIPVIDPHLRDKVIKRCDFYQQSFRAWNNTARSV